jgi:predicted DNA-binding transcriptional regulator YafY
LAGYEGVMAHHPILERYAWLDQQIRHGLYPNAARMANHFELAHKTAQRDIEFMRDRLGAPLEYNGSKRGYSYSDDSFRLPPLYATERQLIALILARQMMKKDNCPLDRDLGKFAEILLSCVSYRRLSPGRLDHLFSAVWSGHAPTEPQIFQAVLRALTQDKILGFAYKSPANGQLSDRLVEPHHLQYYQGSWLLLAWCRQAGDWRKFYLARMQNITVCTGGFTPRPHQEWQAHLEGAFGIFQGQEVVWVRLRFSADRARWIQEQQWHEKQEMRSMPDGALELRLPVADLREIHLRILQHGADVEVLEPAKLREMIRQDAVRMTRLYEK